MRPPAYSAERPGLVRPVRVDPAGILGPTPAQARGPFWRPIGRGHFLPHDVDWSNPQQRVLEASILLPPDGMVVGWGALSWLNARWFDGIDARGDLRPVTLAVIQHGIRSRPGAVVCGERFAPGDRFVHDGVCIAEPLVATAFEMRYAVDVHEAVRILDMAAYNDLVSVAEMHQFTYPGLNAWTGVEKVREALTLADENAWSPPEVDMRLVLNDAGYRSLLTNRPVFDLSGRHVGTPDLLDADAGVAIEYDGESHLAGRQRRADLDREGDLRRVGLEYVTMVAADRRDPVPFLRRVRDARGRAQSGNARQWTVEKPWWWIPTETVAQRRALSEFNRDRLLRHRAG